MLSQPGKRAIVFAAAHLDLHRRRVLERPQVAFVQAHVVVRLGAHHRRMPMRSLPH